MHGGGYRMIRFASLILLLSLSWGLPTPAHADDVADCKSELPTTAIAGCTRLLKGGKLNAQGRAAGHAFRARAYLRKGDVEEALADATRAVQADPKYSSGYYARAGVYSQKGGFTRALADLARIVEREPKNAGAYQARAAVMAKKGALAAAIADFTRAIVLVPKLSAFFNARGH